MEERYINGNFPFRFLCQSDEIDQISCSSLYHSERVTFNSVRYLWHEFPLLILLVVIPLHCIGLSCTSLPICEYSRMVPINHFFNHICYSCLLIQVRLRSWPIRYQIKVKLLAILILLVQVQLNDAIGRVDMHSARVVIVRAGLLQVLAV